MGLEMTLPVGRSAPPLIEGGSGGWAWVSDLGGYIAPVPSSEFQERKSPEALGGPGCWACVPLGCDCVLFRLQGEPGEPGLPGEVGMRVSVP